jgi:5-methylcytosine-specific restriction endonuclease McrA
MSEFHYRTPAWKALRLAAKRRDGWRCVKCGSRVGLEVDHIEPRERRPELALSLDNLATLCRVCHIEKTRDETGRKMDPRRKAWLRAIDDLRSKPGL